MPYERTEITRPKGINKDLSPYELPPDVWSDGANVNFRRNRTNKQLGYKNPFTINSTSISPIFLKYFTDNIDTFWLYASEETIMKTDGETIATLGTGFNATRSVNWSGFNFNGVLVLNNYNDHPQWLPPSPTGSGTYTYDAVEDLFNWGVQAPDSVTPPAEYLWTEAARTSVIRGYKNYLFALDCTDKDGLRYPSMIRWSSPAKLGDAPPYWDPDSPSEQAGLYQLTDSPGRIVDGLTLGDYFVIYKTDSVWLVQFIGGEFNFSFRKLFGDDAGMLAKECVAEFEGKHFVLSPTGAYVHNGATKQEIMDPWVKDEFFKKVDPDQLVNTRVVADHNHQEIWVYYTSGSSTSGWCDRALVWNWTIGEWTIRELTGISYIAEGIVERLGAGVDDWNSDSEVWDSDITIWNDQVDFNPTELNLLLADPVENLLYGNELDIKQAGITMNGWVQRFGIDFNDDFKFKYLSRVIPHVIGTEPVTITLYSSNTQVTNPTIQQVLTFDPKQDQDVDCHVTGRYLGIKFECNGDFKLTGYTLVWEPTGDQ